MTTIPYIKIYKEWLMDMQIFIQKGIGGQRVRGYIWLLENSHKILVIFISLFSYCAQVGTGVNR